MTTTTAIASPPEPDPKPVIREYHGRDWPVLTPDGDPGVLQRQRIEQLGREINFNLSAILGDDDAYERGLVLLSFALGCDPLVNAPPLNDDPATYREDYSCAVGEEDPDA